MIAAMMVQMIGEVQAAAPDDEEDFATENAAGHGDAHLFAVRRRGNQLRQEFDSWPHQGGAAGGVSLGW